VRMSLSEPLLSFGFCPSAGILKSSKYNHSGCCAPLSESLRVYATLDLATKLIQMHTPGLRILHLISSFKRAIKNHSDVKHNDNTKCTYPLSVSYLSAILNRHVKFSPRLCGHYEWKYEIVYYACSPQKNKDNVSRIQFAPRR
jgi:hypothetical protein